MTFVIPTTSSQSLSVHSDDLVLRTQYWSWGYRALASCTISKLFAVPCVESAAWGAKEDQTSSPSAATSPARKNKPQYGAKCGRHPKLWKKKEGSLFRGFPTNVRGKR